MQAYSIEQSIMEGQSEANDLFEFVKRTRKLLMRMILNALFLNEC